MSRLSVRDLLKLDIIEGKVGMQRGNRPEDLLWAQYDERLVDLATDADATRQALIGADEAVVANLPPVELTKVKSAV